MKAILLVAFFSFSFLSATADSNIAARRFIARQDGLINEALRSVIQNRCDRYIPYFEIPECKKAVVRMLSSLDYDVIVSNKSEAMSENWEPNSFVFVAFKKDFFDLLTDPKVTTYLENLNQELYRYLTHQKSRANVWEFTLSYFRTPFLASRAMAVLFQDTGPTKLHLAYLEKAGIQRGQIYDTNKELLNRVIDTINLVLNNSEARYRKLFYPPEIEKHLNRNIYHFYVPHYLVQYMTLFGARTEDALRASLMMTLTYEFITEATDFRYLYQDPPSIMSEHKIKDIFAGYSGGILGIKGMKLKSSYEEVKSMFNQSSAAGVEILLRR